MDDVSKELRAVLDYVAGKWTEDPYVKKLDDAVKEAKKNREWRHEYMTLLMRDQENIEKGRAEGKTGGRIEELYSLVQDGLLSLSVAAKRAGMSEEKFLQAVPK